MSESPQSDRATDVIRACGDPTCDIPKPHTHDWPSVPASLNESAPLETAPVVAEGADSGQVYAISWQGVDQDGQSRGGRTVVTDPSLFVRAKFRAGWRTMTVTCDGEGVGGIRWHEDVRSWWGRRAAEGAK